MVVNFLLPLKKIFTLSLKVSFRARSGERLNLMLTCIFESLTGKVDVNC
jgi:hypothetical protein